MNHRFNPNEDDTTAKSIVLEKINANIDNQQFDVICQHLKDCHELRSLKMNLLQNKINQIGVHYLAPVWKSCSQLLSLNINIQNNKIGDAGIKHLGADLKPLGNRLKELTIELTNTNITKNGVDQFGKGLEKLISLEKLELHCGYNCLQKGIIPISSAVKQLPLLKILILDLYENMVEDKDFCTFISSIGHCLTLEQFELNVQGNFLSETSGTAMSKALSCLKELRKLSLYLESNKIGQSGLISLGKILPTLTKLQDIHLDLNENDINGTGMTGFAKHLQLCTGLTRFSMWLGGHNVDGKGINDLMQSLRASKNIQLLKLDITARNKTESLIQNLSDLLSDLKELVQLQLRLKLEGLGEKGIQEIATLTSQFQQINTISLLCYESKNMDKIKNKLMKQSPNLVNITCY